MDQHSAYLKLISLPGLTPNPHDTHASALISDIYIRYMAPVLLDFLVLCIQHVEHDLGSLLRLSFGLTLKTVIG